MEFILTKSPYTIQFKRYYYEDTIRSALCSGLLLFLTVIRFYLIRFIVSEGLRERDEKIRSNY